MFQSERCAMPPPLHRDGPRSLVAPGAAGKTPSAVAVAAVAAAVSRSVGSSGGARCQSLSLSLSLRGYKRHANLDKSSGRGGWTDAPEEPREQHPPRSGNVLPGSVEKLCKISGGKTCADFTLTGPSLGRCDVAGHRTLSLSRVTMIRVCVAESE